MAPTLSVIVPTVKPWPQGQRVLDALGDQALATNTEVIVADGRGGVPDNLDEPYVTMLLLGADVFELRAAAVERAHGDLIALLEDHVIPASDWCVSLIRAFREQPDAAGVIGSIDNGAPGVLDRASFLLTFAPFLAPLDGVPTYRCPPPGLIAYRKSAISAGLQKPGWLEYELPVVLRDRGQLVAADRVRVTHTQYVGARSLPLQYHAGRVFGGIDHDPGAARSRRERLVQAFRMPVVLTRQTLDALRARHISESPACLAAMATLAASNGLGQALGVLRGTVGHSPDHLE